ncbi:hypothetical protein RHGRI_034507 [Rhododendron griersonianum]|uniref:CLAVATA3/ESR (CLE)-related protein 25 n=1 Tax=Rhododendron griersonianum TaxID=479676 RepID=A0AAV6I0W6_9ERIC|nr:hypothetical protein RHGRI_034507 [Rhododendron griersonianum]
MGWSGRLVKALFGVLALVLVIRLMLVGGLETAGGTSTQSTMVKTRPDGSFKRVNQKDLNHVSKRRIPNGPDPIHNRRAGNSGAPPNQV